MEAIWTTDEKYHFSFKVVIKPKSIYILLDPPIMFLDM